MIRGTLHLQFVTVVCTGYAIRLYFSVYGKLPCSVFVHAVTQQEIDLNITVMISA